MTTIPSNPAPASAEVPTRSDLFLNFALVGLTGFGGVLPWARRMIVERRGWLTDREFAELLPLAQLLPGPNVSNLATMLGRRYRGASGAAAAVFGLYLCPTIIVIVLGYVYRRWSDAPVMHRLLDGLMPVAAGLMIATALKLVVGLPRSVQSLLLVLATFVAVGVLALPLLGVLAVAAPLATWLAWRAPAARN
jgi:chromate transporter